MSRIILSISLFFFFSCSDPSVSQEFQKKIAQTFSKENAFETVRLMEKYWRVAGNTGFNTSIYHIENTLKNAGFIHEENAASSDRLIYRIETRPMKRLTWEPVAGSVKIGEELLLDYNTNRHLVALNSYSFKGDIDVVKVSDTKVLSADEVKGKLVYGEGSSRKLYKDYVVDKGAKGIVLYSMPKYLNPEINTTSIQFRSIAQDSIIKPFGIILSYEAKNKLDAYLADGNKTLSVDLETKLYPSVELTIVANMLGETKADERFVYSAHVQEPGANDNASGSAVLLEMANVTAQLFKNGSINPQRSITFLYGDEIISTRRYVTEDSIRAKGIKWGMSLDMVGEKTRVTGGTFLIEKMPDPSAIWTRGDDKHTEWGGKKLEKKDMMPHYLNDFVLNRMLERAEVSDWVVNTNPFEGGSDHVPFLRANIPGVLLWHFTDQFYHTDQDRLDKVDPNTLENVGIGALSVALTLASDYPELTEDILKEIYYAGRSRLIKEMKLSNENIKNGANVDEQKHIVIYWKSYYQNVLRSVNDLGLDVDNTKTLQFIYNKYNMELSRFIKPFLTKAGQ